MCTWGVFNPLPIVHTHREPLANSPAESPIFPSSPSRNRLEANCYTNPSAPPPPYPPFITEEPDENDYWNSSRSRWFLLSSCILQYFLLIAHDIDLAAVFLNPWSDVAATRTVLTVTLDWKYLQIFHVIWISSKMGLKLFYLQKAKCPLRPYINLCWVCKKMYGTGRYSWSLMDDLVMKGPWQVMPVTSTERSRNKTKRQKQSATASVTKKNQVPYVNYIGIIEETNSHSYLSQSYISL